jgi:tripartite-type tricarboxylate transporter receptor subunit TctC
VVNPYIYNKLQYHLQDFAPITGLFAIYQCLCANPSLPANSVAELIALARAKPGALNYGTFGVGSSGHLNMEMFAKMAGVKLTAVHYKGAAPATNDVIAGHIQLVSVAIGSAVPQIEGHKLKALGVGSPKRLAKLPDIPAVAETVPGYEARSWFGLFAPAKTPVALVDRINGDVREVFKKPELKTFLDREFFEPMTSSPADFLAFIHAEEAKWSKVVHDAGVKLN